MTIYIPSLVWCILAVNFIHLSISIEKGHI